MELDSIEYVILNSIEKYLIADITHNAQFLFSWKKLNKVTFIIVLKRWLRLASPAYFGFFVMVTAILQPTYTESWKW